MEDGGLLPELADRGLRTGACGRGLADRGFLLPPSKPPAPAFQPFRYILTAIPLSDRYSLRSLISSSL